jgi:hypothetical protein
VDLIDRPADDRAAIEEAAVGNPRVRCQLASYAAKAIS